MYVTKSREADSVARHFSKQLKKIKGDVEESKKLRLPKCYIPL